MARAIRAGAGEAAAAIALGAVGGFFAWHANRLPFGTLAEPGPGFLPLLLGLLLVACAAALLWRTRIAARGMTGTELGHRDVVIAYLALVLLPLGFERLGAGITFTVFIAVLLVAIDAMAWWRAIVGAAVSTSVVWLVFKHLLGVQLPRGLL